MNISIICPLYNAEKYIIKLHKSILKQRNVEIEGIYYTLTESSDNTKLLLQSISANYISVKKSEFSHSLTREKVARKVDGDIIVFISQDIIIEKDDWLYNLTKDIIDYKCEAAFSRQVSNVEGIEKYIRLKNYPTESRIVTKKDVKRLGLMTFFFSDASSAIRKDIFIKLNGYDGKKLPTNEDMYLAHKIIMNGYRIKYCADSVVVHSHKLTLKQLYKRYFNTGIFFENNKYLQNYNVNGSGLSLVKFIFFSALKNLDIKMLLNLIPNFAVRYIGMRFGKSYAKH